MTQSKLRRLRVIDCVTGDIYTITDLRHLVDEEDLEETSVKQQPKPNAKK